MIRTKSENGVATITLDRPEKLNAFAGTMREDLRTAIATAMTDDSCRVVIITGAGRAFCAGGDVEFMAGLQRAGDTGAFGALLDAGAAVIRTIVESPKPVIAAVNGIAAGAGCNLALACDFRIAASTAKFGETFIRIGLHPDWGGTWLLPRLVGRGRAFELMATGRMIDAAEAQAIGMVERVVDPAAFEGEVAGFANALAAAPPIALSMLKDALRRSVTSSLAEQLDIEREHQIRAFASSDAAEGMQAFFEKRAAQFRGA